MCGLLWLSWLSCEEFWDACSSALCNRDASSSLILIQFVWLTRRRLRLTHTHMNMSFLYITTRTQSCFNAIDWLWKPSKPGAQLYIVCLHAWNQHYCVCVRLEFIPFGHHHFRTTHFPPSQTVSHLSRPLNTDEHVWRTVCTFLTFQLYATTVRRQFRSIFDAMKNVDSTCLWLNNKLSRYTIHMFSTNNLANKWP